MKKIIYIFGVLFLAIIIISNILFNARMNLSEHITISWNNIAYIIGLAIIGVILLIITTIVDKFLNEDDSKQKRKIKSVLLVIAMAIYIIFSMLWVILVRPGIVADQIHVGNTAQGLYHNNLEEILPSKTYAGISLGEYLQAYGQQFTLAFVYSTFFRIVNCDVLEVLRTLNVIGNILIVAALYKITKQLSKKYKTNKVLMFTLILTFATIPMLSTFVYGDIPSLALCLWAVYFMMKYTETKKWKYAIVAAILTMIAYMMRMNSLIFIIATVIYLLLNIFKEITKKPWKENLLGIGVIILYIIIAIVPSSLLKNYYISKYNLDKNKSIPVTNYILMAMEESPRANGWYRDERGEYTLKNTEAAKAEYPEKIKERIEYFAKNPKYAAEFYGGKIASMWTENTYSVINYNLTKINDPLRDIADPLAFYQKALLIITCLCSLIVLIQNRKNLSLDVLFLITIFIGGFAFHILWEAKSRYIIPYIVVLIPVASISINKMKKKLEKNNK